MLDEDEGLLGGHCGPNTLSLTTMGASPEIAGKGGGGSETRMAKEILWRYRQPVTEIPKLLALSESSAGNGHLYSPRETI